MKLNRLVSKYTDILTFNFAHSNNPKWCIKGSEIMREVFLVKIFFIVLLSIFQKKPQNVGIRGDTGSGLTVLSRRLRTRQLKSPIIRRGPGRPKNDNIPAPEKNEKGETFYRCEECKATVKTYNALIGMVQLKSFT